MPDPSITVEEGCTLIEALSAIHPEAKKNSLRRMISQGRTRIDGVRGAVSYTHLRAHETLR